MGTIVVPLFLLLSTKLLGGAGLLFVGQTGTGQLVQTGRPKKDILGGLGRPASNLFMGIIWVLLLRLFLMAGVDIHSFGAKWQLSVCR